MSDPAPESPLRPDFGRAVWLREAGRFAEAKAELDACLAQEPDHPAVLAALAQTQIALGDLAGAQATAERLPAGCGAAQRTAARLQLRAGQAPAAVASARAALAAEPEDADNALVLALALISAGDVEAAKRLAEEVLARDPGRAQAHVVLAQAAQRQGEEAAAVEAMAAALRLKPHLPLWASLGALQMGLGRSEAAAVSLRRGLETNPRDVQALINLGEAERRLGRLAEAEELLRRATALSPDHAVAWGNLGAVLQQDRRPAAAREAYDRALAIDPNAAAVKVNLGRLLADEGRLGEAEAVYRAALAHQPDLAAGHFALAGVLRSASRLEDAEASYRRALALQPDFPEAQLGLAAALMERLEFEEAYALLEDALARRPTLDIFIQARLRISAMAASLQMIEAERDNFRRTVEEALTRPGQIEDAMWAASTGRFYLAYHAKDDRPLMEAFDELFAVKAPGLAYEAPNLASRKQRRGERIRVGFVSQYFSNHTIGRLYRGFIGQLDRSRFEVIVANFPRTSRDAMRTEIQRLAVRAIELSPAIEEQRAQLSEADLDVLFYPDIGMSPASYMLARSRLAPVQAVSWGHPDTTGLKTIDYFVSSGAFEAPGAEAHYTERLIRMGRLPSFYDPAPVPSDRSRADLGLPDGAVLYGCPQSLFKLHPAFDPVLAEIVDRDPKARLVFLEGRHPSWSAALRRRWSTTFPQLLAKAHFQPGCPVADFVRLMAEMDVLLDPPHFGSGNTLYEAMAVGTPIVTWPGEFMRGRIVAAAYGQMGVGEKLIVGRLEDYAARAVAVANDAPAGRAALRDALRAAAGRELFADTRALREIEDFLAAAVAAADRGERLPSGWGPHEAAR